MSSIPTHHRNTPLSKLLNVTGLTPDFPYDYRNLLENAKDNNITPFVIDPTNYGEEVAIIGGGISGIVAAYECMRMGLKPIIFEATDRLGGRLYSMRRGASDNRTIAELGAMRFPIAGKSVIHYFDKVGMSSNKTPFPSPGSSAAISTMVDYLGEQNYYEPDDQVNFPTPPEYTDLEDKFIVNFLNTHPYELDNMVEWTTEPITPEKQQNIKNSWNALIDPPDDSDKSWDYKSFLECLTDDPTWTFSEVEMFGQIGFGTGGWNTDFPNCFLEVLRVMYTSLDVDLELMYDGCEKLPNDLYTSTPASLGDSMVSWPSETTLEMLSTGEGRDPLNLEVRHVNRLGDGTFDVKIFNKKTDQEESFNFPAVIYAAPIRLLDKMRHKGTQQDYEDMTNNLFDAEAWEAIMYTHYMQSTKIFVATNTAFWRERDANDPPRESMSVTLSDRLTRGTYLVDYSGSAGEATGPGIFLSYTWNDDSLKFLDGEEENFIGRHVEDCLKVLQDIYPNVDFQSEIQIVDGDVELNWENAPYSLGGFKMNLPGQYRYQKRIFSQFMDELPQTADPDPFVLVGDDVSWTAGWTEGAVTTAINAVNKMAVVFGGGVNPSGGVPGPMDEWELWGPVDIAEKKTRTVQVIASHCISLGPIFCHCRLRLRL